MVGGGEQGLIIGVLRHVIFNEKSFRLLGIRVKTPGASFSKFPKVFGPVKPQQKSSKYLMFTKLFFSHNFNTNKVNFHAKFNAYTLLF